MAYPKHLNGGTHVSDDAFTELSQDSRILLLRDAVLKTNADIHKFQDAANKAYRWALGLLLGVGVSAVVAVGVYKERVDTLTEATKRLEERTIQLSSNVAALAATLDARR